MNISPISFKGFIQVANDTFVNPNQITAYKTKGQAVSQINMSDGNSVAPVALSQDIFEKALDISAKTSKTVNPLKDFTTSPFD